MSVEARRTKAGKTRYLARVRSGTQLVASKTFDRKGDAEAWEREQKHLLHTGRPLPPKRKFTLGGLVAVFFAAREGGNPHTVDTDRNNLAALPAALLARPLASVQAGEIREHLLAELRGGKAPATVARARTTLSALFTYADEQGFLHQPHPVQTMKKIPELSNVAQRAVSPNEIPSPRQVAAAAPTCSSSCRRPACAGASCERSAWAGSRRCRWRNSTSNDRTPTATRRRT